MRHPIPLERPALADHPIHEIIAHRYSHLAFMPRPLEREKLLSLLEAARWAPSSYNDQPWRFIVTPRDASPGGGPEFQKALDCLVPGNQAYCKNAGVIVFAVAALKLQRNGKPNDYAMHDTGAALMAMFLQATSMNIAMHEMAGFDHDKVRKGYDVPEGDYKPATAIAIGYADDVDTLPPDLRKRNDEPRTRRPLSESVFAGKFGKRSPLVS